MFWLQTEKEMNQKLQRKDELQWKVLKMYKTTLVWK